LDKLGFLSYLLKNDCRLSDPDIEMRDSLFLRLYSLIKKLKKKNVAKKTKKSFGTPSTITCMLTIFETLKNMLKNMDFLKHIIPKYRKIKNGILFLSILKDTDADINQTENSFQAAPCHHFGVALRLGPASGLKTLNSSSPVFESLAEMRGTGSLRSSSLWISKL
jgi:hypothetical protein